MTYYKKVFHHTLVSPELDLLVSDLGDLGFESFESEAGVLVGYWPETAGKPMSGEADAARGERSVEVVDEARGERVADEAADLEARLSAVLSAYGAIQTEAWEKMPDVNWNQCWESHYEPVQIGDFCFVHAPFHTERPKVKHYVEIEPKMSFGTAHHPTTSLMIEQISKQDWRNKQVVDMGCGTGILAILAAKEGADVLAIDYDDNACANAAENVERNALSSRITVKQGSSELLAGQQVDVILANINRNILLDHLPFYAAALKPGGKLFLSGFYEADVPVLREKAEALGFTVQNTASREAWTVLMCQYR